MNAATKRALKLGHKPPVYATKTFTGPSGKLVLAGTKIQPGVPYVNPENFK